MSGERHAILLESDEDLWYFMSTGEWRPDIPPNRKRAVQRASKRCRMLKDADGTPVLMTSRDNRWLRVVNREHDQLNLAKKVHQEGHRCGRTMAKQLQTQYYWRKMEETCTIVARSCESCASGKPLPPIGPPSASVAAPQKPFVSFGMDFVPMAKETSEGHKFVLLMQDLHTSWTFGWPMKDNSASAAGTCISDLAEYEHRTLSTIYCPEHLLTPDLEEFCAPLRIKLRSDSSYIALKAESPVQADEPPAAAVENDNDHSEQDADHLVSAPEQASALMPHPEEGPDVISHDMRAIIQECGTAPTWSAELRAILSLANHVARKNNVSPYEAVYGRRPELPRRGATRALVAKLSGDVSQTYLAKKIVEIARVQRRADLDAKMALE